MWLSYKIEVVKTSVLCAVSVDKFYSLTTSEAHRRVEITGVCGFWSLPLSAGKEKVTLSVHHCPWVWEPPVCR